MTTLAELGMPFPLFDAPIEEASGYLAETRCCVCHTPDQPGFELRGGDCLVVACPSCQADNGLRARDQADGSCRQCETTVPFPEQAKRKRMAVCYACLREGKAALTKDTEYGAISWEHAIEGRTHGVPGLETDRYETIVVDPEDDWVAVKMPPEQLFELLRTPSFPTWQGDTWLFCCQAPMTYVGTWQSFAQRRLSQETAWPQFQKLMRQPQFSYVAEDQYESMIDAVYNEHVCLYVFECQACRQFRATMDMD